MNEPHIPTVFDLDALAAMRPRASSFEEKLRGWIKANAEHRAFNATQLADGVLELNMLDVIGEDWWTGGGITSNRVKAALDSNKEAKTIKVLMNSPGGDVFEGLAIQSLLKRTGARIEFEVIGLAASAATVIAMSGDSIKIHEGAMWMVHEAWTFNVGNKRDMRQAADFLEKIDGSIRDIYARRTGRAAEDITRLVEAETWMTAHEAVTEKFATGVIEAKGEPAKNRARNEAQNQPQPPAPQPSPAPRSPAAASAPALSAEEQALVDATLNKHRSERAAADRAARLAKNPLVAAQGDAAPPFGGMHT